MIIGGGLVGAETGEYCLDYCSEVVIVEMLPEIAAGAQNQTQLVGRLKKAGVQMFTETKVLSAGPGHVKCENPAGAFELNTM